MADFTRLIEHAFPLKQASLDSVHEKNVRHGHISTLHIWPARRPLAACRAALIATLLPDPSTAAKPDNLSDAQWEEEIRRRRKELCEKIGGRVVSKTERKRMPSGQIVERLKEETEGGILHWGRETEDAETLNWFREEIRRAYGGRAPKVLDPFAGGGAIPLEAMRLGCEATAIDINPVAWFILKCTLEYPQKLAGQTRPLPDFVLQDDEFMREYFAKARGYGKRELTAAMKALHDRLEKKAQASADDAQGGLPFSAEAARDEFPADLAWHVRAWGRWVLARARKDLASFYPTYSDFEPLDPGKVRYEPQPMRLVPFKEDGIADIDSLNAEFSEDYLADKRNPRWVAKPTVAYLWARTVTCKNCRSTIPLLKTRWLCKKANKRVLLTMEPNVDGTGLLFGVEANVPVRGGNAAQRREHDKRVAAGTLTQSGAQCPSCPAIMTMPDVQVAAQAGEWGVALTAVVVDGPHGKVYRAPTGHERNSLQSPVRMHQLLSVDPLDEPIDPTRPSPNARGLSGLTRYGITTLGDAYSARQQRALATLCQHVSSLRSENDSGGWIGVISDLVALAVDHVANRNTTLCHWDIGRETISSTFQRYALRVNWDFVESNPSADGSGSFLSAIEWIALALQHAGAAATHGPAPRLLLGSATRLEGVPSNDIDLVLTDPPYYDAIPYADLSDFFYVWLRRIVGNYHGDVFQRRITDKSEELVQHAGRTDGSNTVAKQRYEDGMAACFAAVGDRLQQCGRLVVVFAHKQPDAWETLASSIIRAGFSVDASWPIRTEMPNRAAGGARLASSVWLVCKKRPAAARPGWDGSVLADMHGTVGQWLREFWDAGIRGPDFVWAATGPALEAYSKHPVVKKADSPDEIMTVSEFLTHVRRMVVDFVVGRVLSGDGEAEDLAVAGRLDGPTAYYLLHRNDFGLDDAPAGTCILYAVSCGLSDKELVDTWDILARTGGAKPEEDDDDEDGADEGDADAAAADDEGAGSKLRLKTWGQRKARAMGYEAPGGRPIPLIDRVHRLMHLWKAQDLHKVDEYLDDNALRRNELFKRFLQSLIELSARASEERSLLESLSSHVGAKGARKQEVALPLTPQDDQA